MTHKEEKYCQARASGKGKSESYIIAYSPKQKKAVHVRANEVEKRPHIKARIKELQKPVENILEMERKNLIQLAINIALGEIEATSQQTKMLCVMLDKLLPNKKEIKSKNKVSFEDFLQDF